MADLEKDEETETDELKTDQTDFEYSQANLEVTRNQTNYQEISHKLSTIIEGHDFFWYAKIFLWPSVIIIIGEILLEISIRQQLLSLSETTLFFVFLLLSLGGFVAIVLLSFLKFKTNLNQAIIVSLSGAVFTGIIISFFQLIWYRALWTIFNLIGLPLLMILESLIIVLLVYSVLKIINIKK